ncbi:hypothetical protein [Mailhella sp.]|uniref:hypothetical protein n=1 Tax=Mailhella sp. TaxID=1981029 RepID=UPI0040639516
MSYTTKNRQKELDEYRKEMRELDNRAFFAARIAMQNAYELRKALETSPHKRGEA